MKNVLDLQRIKGKVLKYWYVFVLSLIVALGIAYLQNQYEVPYFRAATTVLLKNPTESGEASILFGEMAGVKQNNSLSNELILLKSFPTIKDALSRLNFEISYFEAEGLAEKELYKSSPIEVTTLQSSFPGGSFSCEIQNRYTYTLYQEDSLIGEYGFGEVVQVESSSYQIDLKESLSEEELKDRTIRFQFNNSESLTRTYSEKIQIRPIVNQATVLEVSIEGENTRKNIDFLNKFLETIIEKDIKEKNYFSERTIEFIDGQLSKNSDSLRRIENQLQSFKNSTSSIDLTTEASNTYTKIQQLESERAALELAEEYHEYLRKALNKGDALEEVVVPSTFGVESPTLNTFIGELVALQRDARLFVEKEGDSKNPRFLEKLQRIKEIKLNILSNLKSLEETNEIAVNDINRRIAVYEKALGRIPAAERRLVSIQRKFNLNESLYMLLMQKKMEAGINKASNASKYKVINYPYIAAGPLGTGSTTSYLIAIVLGLGLPAGILYLSMVMDSKVYTKEDIVAVANEAPFLASVPPRMHKGDIFEGKLKLNTVFLESFRMIRANIRFLSEKREGNVITFSSSLSGEGKSFSSQYLAFVLALSGKKVLLVDADLRKPMTEKRGSGMGLSEYLIGDCEIEDIIKTTEHSNLFHIDSGAVPPNPSELLMSTKSKELLEGFRNRFDYIIVDTSPVGLVSDAIAIMKWSDINILVARSAYTVNSNVKNLVELNQKYKFPGFSFILNHDKTIAGQYGYGNYYFGDEDQENKAIKSLMEN